MGDTQGLLELKHVAGARRSSINLSDRNRRLSGGKVPPLERQTSGRAHVLGPLEMLLVEEEEAEAKEKAELAQKSEKDALRRKGGKLGGRRKSQEFLHKGAWSPRGSRTSFSPRPSPRVSSVPSAHSIDDGGSGEGSPIPRPETPIIRWKRSVPVRLALDLPKDFAPMPWLAHVEEYIKPTVSRSVSRNDYCGAMKARSSLRWCDDNNDAGLPPVKEGTDQAGSGPGDVHTRAEWNNTVAVGNSSKGEKKNLGNYGAWYIPPTERKATGGGSDGGAGSAPGVGFLSERQDWHDMPEKFKTKAQKEEEQREREYVAKLSSLKKELGGLASTKAYRDFLIERGGRLPHYLLDLEENAD